MTTVVFALAARVVVLPLYLMAFPKLKRQEELVVASRHMPDDERRKAWAEEHMNWEAALATTLSFALWLFFVAVAPGASSPVGETVLMESVWRSGVGIGFAMAAAALRVSSMKEPRGWAAVALVGLVGGGLLFLSSAVRLYTTVQLLLSAAMNVALRRWTPDLGSGTNPPL